jgi:hypothetical protein
MRKRTAVLAALVAALAAAPAIALGGASSNSQTFTDQTGEDPAGVDIASVAVSNDDAGLISFQVNVTNRPALTADMLFQVYIDTVPGVGDAQNFGADYVLQLLPGGIALFQWNGSEFPAAASQSSVSYTYAAGGPTMRVGAADLGKPTSVNIVVFAVSGIGEAANGDPDYTNAHGDLAPNFGTYTYEVKTTLTLKVVRVTTSPRPARAGKAFSAALAATRNDTGGPVPQGTVACTARIDGKTVPVKARRVTNGVAACSWTLPKTAAGRTIRGTITLSVEGARVTRSFSARVS